jgi:hypothetical protein
VVCLEALLLGWQPNPSAVDRSRRLAGTGSRDNGPKPRRITRLEVPVRWPSHKGFLDHIYVENGHQVQEMFVETCHGLCRNH